MDTTALSAVDHFRPRRGLSSTTRGPRSAHAKVGVGLLGRWKPICMPQGLYPGVWKCISYLLPAMVARSISRVHRYTAHTAHTAHTAYSAIHHPSGVSRTEVLSQPSLLQPKPVHICHRKRGHNDGLYGARIGAARVHRGGERPAIRAGVGVRRIVHS